MLGFNKIMQIQPSRQQLPSRTPLGVNEQRRGSQATPVKRPATLPNDGPTSNRARMEFTTPVRRPFMDHSNLQNAPLKKRIGNATVPPQQGNTSYQEATRVVRSVDEDVSDEINDIDSQSMLFEEDSFPGNQQALYDGGFGDPSSQEQNENLQTTTSATTTNVVKGKIGFERVNEETVEMGGFILPGSEKKSIHKSYNWIAGRADGQYRVVLGYNTLFKAKNAVDSTTGEKDFNRWRVVRFENRYKENYPYTEFPAKYLEPLIQALEKAREQHALELKEESVL